MPKNITKAFLLIWIFLLVVGPCVGIACSMTLVGPYPQSSKVDSIVISWKTTTPTTQNMVRWGSTPMLGNISKEKSTYAHMFHTVTITGLAAGRQYYYTVVSDDTESSLYTFWTAFPSNETIRFVAYGDSQGDWDNWQTVLLVSQAIEKTNPAFVIKPGDLVDNGRNPDDWIEFFLHHRFFIIARFSLFLGITKTTVICFFPIFHCLIMNDGIHLTTDLCILSVLTQISVIDADYCSYSGYFMTCEPITEPSLLSFSTTHPIVHQTMGTRRFYKNYGYRCLNEIM